MALIPCPECKEQVSDRAVVCPRCGCPMRERAPEQPRPRRPLGPMKYIYWGCLLVGLAIASYIYLIRFDDLSETLLIQLTPLWFFFIVLGYYGLVAERMLVAKDKSQGELVADSLFEMVKAAAPGSVGKLFSTIVYLPFLLVRSHRSWVVATVGAAVWALVLWVFFTLIFPSL